MNIVKTSNHQPLPLIPPEAVFSVAEFIELTNNLLAPLKVSIRGEVSQVKERGGAVYFCLKDAHTQATLNCLIWRSTMLRLDFKLQDGQEIQATGQANVYAPTGRLTFIASRLSPVGEGALQKAFLALQQRLDQAGFFAPERKQILPKYVQSIGLITAKHGDAIRDFLTHIGTYHFRIQHYDVRVEGPSAIDSIVQAIAWFNQQPQRVQVLVLTRGGGSLASLQAFNSEEVAKAIFASKIPVVSGVGHENDVTIADLVADVRASTPTDAGKILSQDWHEAGLKLDQYQRYFWQTAQHVWQKTDTSLDRYWQTMIASWQQNWLRQQQHMEHLSLSLRQQLQQRWQHFQQIVVACAQNQRRWQQQTQTIHHHLQTLQQTLIQSITHWHQLAAQKLESEASKLMLSNPENRLAQGYSLIIGPDGKLLKSIKKLHVQELIRIKMSDGVATSLIQSISTNEKEQ